jgi:cytochrome c oxidase subunit 2
MPATVRVKHPVVIAGALLALLLPTSTALAGNGGFSPVNPASPNAEAINQSYLFISIFAVAIFLLVEGLLVLFVVKYRRRRRPRDQEGAQIHGSNRLELAWTVAPVLILCAIGSFVFWKLPVVEDVPASAGGRQNLVVEVTGTQFTWYFRYPNGVVAIDRMRAPEGRTVELHVTAPDWDVIHSWWIPKLGGKFDAIPGKVNKTWFSAERTGVFPGQCAELCGIYHARMLASVEVMPAAEFDAWLSERSEQQAVGTSPLGEELWDGTCAKCHGLEGEGGYGPRIAGSELLDDTEAVEQLLREGRGQMPPVGRDWNETEMQALTDYLEQNVGG